MKKLAILFSLLFIQSTVFSQTIKNEYPFEVVVKGTGNPMILIPGLACSGEVWNKTVGILQEKYECHILTLAGFNEQQPINIDNGYLPIIETGIKNYIEKELTSKPVVMGHSLGGFLSMSLASKNAALLEKIIIVDSYPFMSAAFNPNATEENVVPQAKMMKEMIISTPDSVYVKQQETTMSTMMNDAEHIKTAIKWSLASSKETIAQAMFELMTTDLRDEVKNIKVPVLVLGSWYSGKDYGITKEMVQNNFKTQFQDTPVIDIQIADTARHFIMYDEPTWFHEKIKTFVANEQ